MKDKDLDTTLEVILGLIDRDVKIIASNFVDIQLDAHTAQTLCRFATTLASIKDNKQKETIKEKKELDKLSTEELIALYKESTKKE